MRKILPALVFLFALASAAQSYTTVTAANVLVDNGAGTAVNPPGGSSLCFLGVNNQGAAITYTPSGGSPVTGTVCQTLTSGGALTGSLQVANGATASPLGLLFTITVINGSTTYLTIPMVSVSGTLFNYDAFSLQGSQQALGFGFAHLTCSYGARYTSTSLPAGENGQVCNTAGQWQGYPPNPYCPAGNTYQVPQSGGTPMCLPPVVSGFGAPSGFCVTNAEYDQQDATAGLNIWKCVNGAYVNQGGGGGALTLTTTGTSGAATYSGGILNIPVYTGGGGITLQNEITIPESGHYAIIYPTAVTGNTGVGGSVAGSAGVGTAGGEANIVPQCASSEDPAMGWSYLNALETEAPWIVPAHVGHVYAFATAQLNVSEDPSTCYGIGTPPLAYGGGLVTNGDVTLFNLTSPTSATSTTLLTPLTGSEIDATTASIGIGASGATSANATLQVVTLGLIVFDNIDTPPGAPALSGTVLVVPPLFVDDSSNPGTQYLELSPSFMGATGPQGPAGPTGATGPQGPAGPATAAGNALVETANYTVTGSGTVQMNSSSATTVTLPSTVATGFSVAIQRAGTGTVTINPNGVTYDGATSIPLQGEFVLITTDGTGYHSSAPIYTDSSLTPTYVPGTGIQFSVAAGAGSTICADTSGSGMAQSCAIAGFTLTAPKCFTYTTTTANTGALTLAINGGSAKPVVKWLGTALAADDVPADKAETVCYDGTNINLMTIGNAPTGGSAGSAGQLQMAGPTAGTFVVSAVTDDGTSVKSAEPVVIDGAGASKPSQLTLVYDTGHADAGVAGAAVVAPDATGNLFANENNTGKSRVCTGANGICSLAFNPANTQYLYFGGSMSLVNGTINQFISTTSCSSGICTNQAPNNYVAGQNIYISSSTLSCLNGVNTTVSATGLTNTQFEVTGTSCGSSSGTGGYVTSETNGGTITCTTSPQQCTLPMTSGLVAGHDIAINPGGSPTCLNGAYHIVSNVSNVVTISAPAACGATTGTGVIWWNADTSVPELAGSRPYFSGHGTVLNYAQGGTFLHDLITGYSTYVHPLMTAAITAAAGAPVIVTLQPEPNQGVAQDEADFLSLWSQLHNEGSNVYVVQQTVVTSRPTDFNTIYTPRIVEGWGIENTWMWGQRNKYSALVAGTAGGYIDRIVPVDSITSSPQMYNSDGVHWNDGGTNAVADAQNAAMSSQDSFPTGDIEPKSGQAFDFAQRWDIDPNNVTNRCGWLWASDIYVLVCGDPAVLSNSANWMLLDASNNSVDFIKAMNLAGTAVPLELNGSAGTSGQTIISAGPGATPTWGAGSSSVSATTIGSATYVADSGSLNALAATLSPAITIYTAGLTVVVDPANSTTSTTPTLNVSGLGAKAITKNGTAALASGDIVANVLATFKYDGTEFQLQNPQTTSGSYTLPSQYKVWTCETGWGDGLNAIPAGTYLQSFCYNTTGVTVTLTGVKCFVDGGSSSTLNAAGNTLGALLTGALTCTTSFASGTQSSSVALTSGDYINLTFVADGTAKQMTATFAGTY